MRKDIKILVTGVKGQLGFDCINELNYRGYSNIIGVDIEELDITDENAVNYFINQHKPDILINNAAWTQVDKAEKCKDLVYKINALGPKYLAKACKKNDAKIIHISTDYVFNGKGNKPFETNSPKKGLSTYGITKSEGEDFVMRENEKYFIIRTTGVFGINGNNFIKTMIKLADSGRKELSVVDDQIVSITYTKDLAKLICDMIETEKYGIYHAANQDYLSWYELAKEIFELTNKNVIIKPVSTEEYMKLVPGQTRRPKNSRLSFNSLDENGFKRLPNHLDALKRYLLEIGEM